MLKYLNTILLGIIITVGGGFSGLMLNRSIEQGETLAAIKSSQVTRNEVETKLAGIQTTLTAQLVGVQNEQLFLRAKLTEIEIKQAAVAASMKERP